MLSVTSGAVTPAFQRTINVYDSQGGSQPITLAAHRRPALAAGSWS